MSTSLIGGALSAEKQDERGGNTRRSASHPAAPSMPPRLCRVDPADRSGREGPAHDAEALAGGKSEEKRAHLKRETRRVRLAPARHYDSRRQRRPRGPGTTRQFFLG